jgi:hypothetical protein
MALSYCVALSGKVGRNNNYKKCTQHGLHTLTFVSISSKNLYGIINLFNIIFDSTF